MWGPGPLRRLSWAEPRNVAGWALSFVLVTYLAFSDGGFDTVTRNQAGLIVWWILLLLALLGFVPRRFGRWGWTALALLAAFAIWTGLSISWSESAELSADELGRVAIYVGVLLLALMTVRWVGLRPLLGGAASAVGLVGLAAVLSRLHPTWFPVNQQLVFFDDARRLSYPINYWNGLSAFLAMGVPLLLGTATRGRTMAGRALAAAGVPVLALGIFFTISRGGTIALGVGLAAYLLLTDDRLAAIATLAACGAGGAILIAYADARPILQQGTRTAAAIHAGNDMLPLILLVCIAVAATQTGIWLLANRVARPSWLASSRRQGAIRVGGVIAALVIAGVIVGLPGRLDHAWRDFKRPPGQVAEPGATGSLFDRLQSAAGNDRYQYWQLAARVASEHPLEGTGAGTFVFVWARNANALGFIQDAHSLYMQTLSETGYPGFVLIVALVLCLLLAGVWRTLRSPPKHRSLLAAATAGVATYCTSAAYEWLWQLGAVTVLMLILAAVGIAGEDGGFAAETKSDVKSSASKAWLGHRRSLPARILLLLGACAALVAVSLPLAEAQDLARSQTAYTRGHFATAMADARSALSVQPYATSALLQEALVLEKTADYVAAREAAVKATQDEPENWQPWAILSRIESELGNGRAALADFARARKLDPKGSLFQQS